MRNKGLIYRERRHGHDNDDENEEKHERGGRHLQVQHEGHVNECEGERGRSYERCGLNRDDDCKMGSPSTRTMSSLGKATLLVALLFASESIVSAEQRSDTGTLEDGPRLLTRAEGEALVDLAVAHPVAGRRLDCSHLVHQILTAAGLTYPYATSLEIFAGVSQFQRVVTAQPGDLIVWPGHVGLVVDEGQRQFFSATRRGIRTDEYNKDYWRRRGHPRFYRYVVRKDTEIEAPRATASAQ